MHILITGGCGFIGSHLVDFYLAKGDEVTVVDDLSTGLLDNITPFLHNPLFHFEEANIITWPRLVHVVASVDCIYHMAADVGINSNLTIKTIATNIAGTERILRASKATQSNQRIFIASSSEVYGNTQNEILNEEDNLIIGAASRPWSNHAVCKIADEALGMVYYNSSQIPITLLRFFNIIGPRQSGRYSAVVSKFIEQACNNEALTVFHEGKQTRSFCDVRDAVNAIDLLLQNNKSIGEIVNIGHDSEITIADLAKLIRERAHSTSEIMFVHNAAENMPIMHHRPDLKKFSQLTNYKHQWTLEKTIDELISLYLEQRKNIASRGI